MRDRLLLNDVPRQTQVNYGLPTFTWWESTTDSSQGMLEIPTPECFVLVAFARQNSSMYNRKSVRPSRTQIRVRGVSEG